MQSFVKGSVPFASFEVDPGPQRAEAPCYGLGLVGLGFRATELQYVVIVSYINEAYMQLCTVKQSIPKQATDESSSPEF